MRVIRHQIDITDKQTVSLPNWGELLSVAVSRTAPDMCIDLWSVDYEEGGPVSLDVFVVGTGNPVEDEAEEAFLNGKFLGTVVTPSLLVWHVWQGKIGS